MTDAARHESESARVARVLREQITAGSRPPGARLVERAVADELGVSRLPVREALRELGDDGLVVVENGTAVVRHMTSADIADVSEVQVAFHCLAVRLAAVRATARDVEEMDVALADARDALDAADSSEGLRGAHRFRDAVARAARNDVLAGIIAALAARSDPQLSRLDARRTLAVNERIRDAVADRSPDAAESILLAFMSDAWRDHRRTVIADLDGGGPASSPGVAPRLTVVAEPSESTRVAEALRDRILDGVRPPGSSLSERAVARELGVSRLPVRQALRRLAAEGLVDLGAAAGVPAVVHRIGDAETAALDEVHLTLDVVVARAAAERRTTASLVDLRRVIDDCRSAVGDRPAARRAATALRRIVVGMTENRVLAWVDGLVRSRIEWIIGGVDGIVPEIGDGLAVRQYGALYEAIAGRDADLAEQIVRHRIGFKRVARERPGAVRIESHHPTRTHR